MSWRFFIKTILLGLALSISNQSISYGQISSIEELLEGMRTKAEQRKPQTYENVSLEYYRLMHRIMEMCAQPDYPYGWKLTNTPRMHGLDFLALPDELPFLEGSLPRYSRFWVDTDVLNVRSGPGHQHEIVSKTFYGNLEFVYARKGDWVAISPSFKLKNIVSKPEWVHIKYLSANRIDEQVSQDVLKSKCNFQTYGKLDKDKFYIHPYKTHPYPIDKLCVSVLKYLRHQRLLSGKAHKYWQDYEAWRKSQKFPEEYNPQSC